CMVVRVSRDTIEQPPERTSLYLHFGLDGISDELKFVLLTSANFVRLHFRIHVKDMLHNFHKQFLFESCVCHDLVCLDLLFSNTKCNLDSLNELLYTILNGCGVSEFAE